MITVPKVFLKTEAPGKMQFAGGFAIRRIHMQLALPYGK